MVNTKRRSFFLLVEKRVFVYAEYMDLLDTYRDIILHIMLGLQEGESLSINTSPSHLPFARDLAQQATEITRQQVNVVVIEHGRPGDVIPFTPVESEPLLYPPLCSVLLRLDDTEEREWHVNYDPHEVAQSFALLQKVGNLGPPQLDKQIAPWSIAAVPGPLWAKKVFGEHATEEQLWQALRETLKLHAPDARQAWREQISLLNHRLMALNRYAIESVHIWGNKTDLTVAPVSQSRWRGGIQRLANGRAFLPYLPLNRVGMLCDRFSTTGTLAATSPVHVLGKEVQDVVIVFEQGRAVRWSCSSEERALQLGLTIDDGAQHLGVLSLVDEDVPLNSIANYYGHVGFDENRTSSVTLGMGESMYLEALDAYDDEEEFQKKTGCNVSSVRFRVPFGEPGLSVTARLSDGQEIHIMKKGQLVV